MSVTENIIRIRNVTKVFQMGSESIHAVDNVSLNIHKEEVCCLFGKSGSGKSTLLNLIAGLEKPTEGRILFHNKHIERMNEDQLADFRRKSAPVNLQIIRQPLPVIWNHKSIAVFLLRLLKEISKQFFSGGTFCRDFEFLMKQNIFSCQQLNDIE